MPEGVGTSGEDGVEVSQQGRGGLVAIIPDFLGARVVRDPVTIGEFREMLMHQLGSEALLV